MVGIRKLYIVAAALTLGVGCARLSQGSAGGELFDPVDAASTVVLHVDNLSNEPMELRTIYNGKSQFIGSVSGNDSTSLLLDPTIFPTGVLYVVAIPSDMQGRALVGPLTATKGNRIRFTVQPALGMSSAIVIR
ncbi:MAG TPA: hypothetical protein VGM50_19835 [Gemmatimonadaceae bacterium]|jgi:hypothetical protein